MNQDTNLPRLPLTKGQMMIWMGQHLRPDQPLYNVVFAFDLIGELRVAIFEEAFQELVRQSDAMRTVFSNRRGEVFQQILEPLSYEIEYLDWSADPAARQDIENWIFARGNHLFNIEELCFDTALIKLAENHHVWFFNQHHLITDAWGQSIQYQQFFQLYHSLLKSEINEVEPLPRYADYRAYEQQAQQKPLTAFWQEQRTAPISFYGQPILDAQTHATRFAFQLQPQEYQHLQDLTTHPKLRHWTKELSLFNILATIYFAFLHRISGQDFLTIGTPSHNRIKPAFQRTPGLFMEVLPLSVEVAKGDTFLSLFDKVRNQTNAFLKAAASATVDAKLSGSFNTVLNFIKASFPASEDLEVGTRWLHGGHIDANHHLRLQVYNFGTEDGITLEFDFNDSVFSSEQQQAALQYFRVMLDAFLADINTPIASPPLLTGEAAEQQLQIFTGLQKSLPQQSVIEAFEQSVLDHPNAIVAQEGQQQWTYHELNTRANQLAHWLTQKHPARGAKIGVFLPRSYPFLIAVLATGKAGHTYVPIAANTPQERIAWIITHGKLDNILTLATLSEQLPTAIQTEVLLLDDLKETIGHLPGSNLDLEVAPDQIAYQMYTSGSTGHPKGVMISHGALAAYIQHAVITYVRRAKPVFPLATAISFDLTVTSIFTPLVSGGKLIIYKEDLTVDSDLAILDVVKDNLVDTLKVTPGHLELLVGTDYLAKAQFSTLIVGGEQFTGDLAKRVQAQLPAEVTIFNEYGPTEVTVGSVLYEVSTTDETYSSVPIGRPIANTLAYVLDHALNLLPPGLPGELYLGGPQLAEGYADQPALTQERFVSDPRRPGHLMYRTGDTVFLNEQNQLVFVGRKDRQVKLRGHRLELGEVEQAIADLAGIQQVAVDLIDRNALTEDIHHCVSCGLPSNYPNATYDDQGVCMLCQGFTHYQERAEQYFKTPKDLEQLFQNTHSDTATYDCIMLLSGGKDSTYALGQLVEMGLKVLAFTLDNGYISQQALDNVSRVTQELGVDCHVGSTPAMNEIFVDSLERHCNVCNGCFKTIYTLSTQLALEKNIPVIVTGLSRGQFFETRLSEEIFWAANEGEKEIDQIILEARKLYHRAEDAVSAHLDVSMFTTDEVFERVQFVDFYRYTDVSLAEMYTYLDERLPWIRPTDTGRSTNCLINQVGIHVHKSIKGYNNYAFPYSWDVRIGHKEREAALEEINEEIDLAKVARIMREIGYTPRAQKQEHQLVAFYNSINGQDSASYREQLSQKLPPHAVPTRWIAVEELPLTTHGKVDRKTLQQFYLRKRQDRVVGHAPPSTDMEIFLAEIWQEVLGLELVNIEEKFLDLGGHSLLAIRLVARINEALDIELPLKSIFEHPTIYQFSEYLESVLGELMADE